MPVEVRVLHGVLGSESHATARTLAQQAPADFTVSLAELGGEPPDADRALGDGRVSVVLLLSHPAAPAVRAAIRKRGAPSTLVTTCHTAWPVDLPSFFEAYEASDALLISDRDLWECTGRLAGTRVLPSGHDESAAAIFDAVRTAATPSVSAPADLSAEVTVFVTTIGAPSYAACRELLRRQDCTFTMHLLEGVTPLSAALQQMLDQCRTPYYVQVDEDMLLYPHAVRTLYERMSSAPPDVAIVVAYLYDVHLPGCIHGVKIARHAIARRYPWKDQPNVLRRLEWLAADGYRVLELPAGADGRAAGVLGLHSTHATPQMLYDRYLTLERLRRSSPRQLEWFESVPARFLRRFLAAPNEPDLHALLGTFAGAVAGPLPEGAEVRDGRSRPAKQAMMGLGPGARPKQPGVTQLGTDLSALVATLGTPVVESLPITGLRSRTLTRATFRLTLADGRVLKGRRLDSPADADRIYQVVTRLGRPELPRIVAHRGAALLEEWIVGEPAGRSKADVAFIERCGKVLGAIHVTPLEPPVHPETRPEPEAHYDRAECAIRELLRHGVLSGGVAADVRAVARAYMPQVIAVGVVHRDFCGVNIVRGPRGDPFVIDSGSVGIDAIDFDLARTWYRWPLSSAERRAFDAGYRAQRPRASATEQFPFWAVVVLAEATLFRVRARSAAWRVPLRRLERLLRDVGPKGADAG